MPNMEEFNAKVLNIDVNPYANSYYKMPSDGGPAATVLHGSDIPEKQPVPNDKPAVWDLVIEDIRKRDEMGTQKYGTRLQPFNGRNALWDAYQEALDLVVYLRQAIYEANMIPENLLKGDKK